VVLAERDGLRVPNAYGQVPFYEMSTDRPNDSYFTHFDFIISTANQPGLYVAGLHAGVISFLAKHQ